MSLFFKSIWKWVVQLITLGCEGPLGSSENRITVFTNLMTLFGIFVIFTTVPTFMKFNVPVQYYIYTWSLILIAAIVTLLANWQRKFLLARLLGVVMLVVIAWDAAITFGRGFNGFLTLFPALVYSILALSKERLSIRIIGTSICFLSLPIFDWFSYHGILPVTGFHSRDFHIATMMIPSFVVMGMLTIALVVEKSFSDKYEVELKNLNENLESIVAQRTQLLVDAKEEAIQASLLKSQFVANTSHELRTPVQGILGFVGMAQKRLEKLGELNESNDALKKKIEKSLGSAESSSNRLLELIDTLLKITHSENIRFTPRPSKLLLKGLVEQICEEFNSTDDSKIRVEMIYQASLDEISTDRTLLTQVLQNVIGNAVRYSLEEKKVHVQVSQEGEWVEILVINSGYGIANDDRERIFEPFVQGSRTDDTTGGTGLGLSLCRKYIKALDGTLNLLDPSPEHTVFQIKIPIQLSASNS